MKLMLHSLLLASLVLGSAHSAVLAGETPWIDGISLSLGAGDDPGNLDLYRIEMQKRWHNSWFKGGAWYLGGFWETGLTSLQTGVPNKTNVVALSLTPVLRYQRDARLSSGLTPFAEAGVGLHLLSDTWVGENDLSTVLQLGALLGLGLGFGDRGQYELSYRYTHLTNADIKQPNDGLEMHMVKLGYNFN